MSKFATVFIALALASSMVLAQRPNPRGAKNSKNSFAPNTDILRKSIKNTKRFFADASKLVKVGGNQASRGVHTFADASKIVRSAAAPSKSPSQQLSNFVNGRLQRLERISKDLEIGIKSYQGKFKKSPDAKRQATEKKLLRATKLLKRTVGGLQKVAAELNGASPVTRAGNMKFHLGLLGGKHSSHSAIGKALENFRNRRKRAAAKAKSFFGKALDAFRKKRAESKKGSRSSFFAKAIKAWKNRKNTKVVPKSNFAKAIDAFKKGAKKPAQKPSVVRKSNFAVAIDAFKNGVKVTTKAPLNARKSNFTVAIDAFKNGAKATTKSDKKPLSNFAKAIEAFKNKARSVKDKVKDKVKKHHKKASKVIDAIRKKFTDALINKKLKKEENKTKKNGKPTNFAKAVVSFIKKRKAAEEAKKAQPKAIKADIVRKFNSALFNKLNNDAVKKGKTNTKFGKAITAFGKAMKVKPTTTTDEKKKKDIMQVAHKAAKKIVKAAKKVTKKIQKVAAEATSKNQKKLLF